MAHSRSHGGIAVINSLKGEQQRPSQQLTATLTKPAQWFRAALPSGLTPDEALPIGLE